MYLQYGMGTRNWLFHKRVRVPNFFDLEKDISEVNDLAKQRPERVVELENVRKQWNNELIEPTFLGLIHRKGWGEEKRNESSIKRSRF